ncbi:uncharacterized protein LOC133197767 [Saccostrea echinata]|uniref:uncharacterized protein LOC133197767 n=1 Tax=Saccostrea echinata TaxID=191078 RepID=UPI002A819295|nr:uncharacterized protein LOC133197767 [Saccostrea echinata]
MRFWRRSRQSRHFSTFEDSNARGVTELAGGHGLSNLRWNPFYRVSRAGRFHPFHSVINPFLHQTQEHVPKCLALVSHSEILRGQSVENFSHECWLQNHLHQFAHSSVNNPSNNNVDLTEEVEDTDDVDDDSPVGSDTERHSVSSVNSFEFDDDEEDDLQEERSENQLPPDIFNYTMAIELPPYNNEPPPSYEEAVAEDARRERQLNSSTRSRDAFLW